MLSSFLKISFITIFATGMQFYVPAAYAKTSNDEVRRAYSLFNTFLTKKGDKDLQEILSISEIVSDRLLDEQKAEGTESTEIALFQQASVDAIIDHLTSSRGPMVFVKGDPGSGKTAVINEVILKMATGDVPGSKAFQAEVGDVITFKVSMRNFVPGMKWDIQYYMNVVRTTIQNIDKRKIAVYFTDAEFITPYIASVLKGELDQPPGKNIQVLLETDNKSYGNSIATHPSLTKIASTETINAPKPAQVVEILKKRQVELDKRYDVKISDALMAAIVDISADYRRDVGEPSRSLQLLEKFMINQRRKAGDDHEVVPDKTDLYRYIAEQLKLPVVPQDEQKFADYMENVKKEIKEELIGQDVNVDGIVDQYVSALTSRSRQHTSAMLLGPTGVGKTLIGHKLAEKFYGDKNRLLEIDMTQFGSANALDTLFGATNGMVSADKDKGVLCDFFDGPGQGGGIVILNEIEEMPAEALTRFMEMLDNGWFRGGDGKIHYVGRTMFLLTSNKNADQIISYDAIRGMTRSELNRRISNISQDQMKKAFTKKKSYTEDSRKQAKPAVFERIDHFYFFSPLLTEEGVRVAGLEVNNWIKDYNKSNVTQIEADDSVAEVATSAFYNEALGARQVKRSLNIFLSKAIGAFKKEHGYDVANLKVSATTHPSLKTVSYITVTDPVTGKKTKIDGPRMPVGNRLLDKEFRDALVGLEDKLNSEIYGQSEATKMIADAMMSHYFEGGKEVAALFLLGVTGSGKSEIGKLVAKYLYGREDAIGIFDMGKIQTKHDLSTILSPAKGIIGSDEPGLLEQFLIDHPDGGVLMFDEISNAGGDDVGLRQSIVKQFYQMMNEGYYVSPSGNVYNLSNYMMLFTGNDGEQVTKGMTSDTMLEESHKEFVKDPNNVRELLNKVGFTDAFMGRLAGITLMRPTLSSTKKLIAGKMLGRWRKAVEKKGQPFDITWDQNLVDEVGLLMFSPTTGARSMREFLSHTLGAMVAKDAMTKADWETLLGSGKKAKVEMSITTIKPTKPFYEGEEPEKTEAILKLVMTAPTGEILSEQTVDFTKRANFQPTVHVSMAEATAYHEMGHAVTTYEKILGLKLIKITITPERVMGGLQALGYAQFRPVPKNGPQNKDYLVKSVASLFSGSEAENIFRDDRNGGRSNDVQRATGIVRKMVLDAHLNPEFDAMGVYLDKNGEYKNVPRALQKRFDAYVVEIIDLAKKQAIDTIEEQWHVIAAGSKLLMELGSINEKQIEALLAEGLRFEDEMKQLVASGGWTKERGAEIGAKIDLAKVKAAGTADCVQNLTPAGADAEKK